MNTRQIFKVRFDRDRTSTKEQLKVALERLEQEVCRARGMLERGERLDEHIVHNAGGITAMIAKYNTHVEYGPYLDAEDEK